MKPKKTGPSESGVVGGDRFKLLPVSSRIPIKDFVSANGISFAPGRGSFMYNSIKKGK